ncbi:ABC transporter substrate-binding protein [Paenibacillus ferrarius]|uniref:ABC transporter substrate-binding protein n=1 Tax=Paenibacillus ferrarius TaxID=1469647 RepID=UPI003D27BAEE
MKTKSFQKATLLTASATMVLSIAACSKNNEDAGAATAPSATASSASSAASTPPSPVTLKFLFLQTKPAEMDKVLAEFEKRTKDTLNTKLDIEFTGSELAQKFGLKMAAGEEVDLSFDYPSTLYPNIARGYYQPLEQYFNNDVYPGLKRVFPPELIEANKVNGHLYSIPMTEAWKIPGVIYYRKDLREKYGLQPIKTTEEFQVFMDKVKEQNPELVPLAVRNTRGFANGEMFANEEVQKNIRTNPYFISGTGVNFSVVLSNDGKKVLGAVTLGDPASDYANLPAPYNKPDYLYQYLDKYVQWNKYLEEDVLAQKNPGALFNSGKAAASEWNVRAMADVRETIHQAIPGADIEYFVYNTKVAGLQPQALGTSYIPINHAVIPVTSKKVDRTMKVLDWIFSSQDNNDLFTWGIEGEHWTKVGDHGYSRTDDQAKKYSFPWYELSMNSMYERTNTNADPYAKKVLQFVKTDDAYYTLPLAQFVFDPTPVKTEIAKVSLKLSEYMPLFVTGSDSNWRDTAAKMNKELRALGLEKIRAELVKQVQVYLDKGGK